jgi:Bacterial Ig domain
MYSSTGDLRLDDDGSFRYRARKCFTGDATFTYVACYKDFDDIESDQATVKISISSAGPDKPEPQDDTYEVLEGEDLDVSKSNGLLWNDVGGSLLYVDDITLDSGFEGSVHVDEDGGLSYDYSPGKLGDFTFKYKVCQDGWEDCVDCAEGKVTIKVLANPDKPTSPPAPGSVTYETNLGNVLLANLVETTSFDSRYTLEFTNFVKLAAFDGTLNGESDGNFEYGNAPVGEDVFTFTICYVDLCADGQGTIETISSANDISSRAGVATFYELRWSGQVQGSTCGVIPTVILRCGGEGTLSLVSLAGVGADDNSMCQNSTLGDGSLECNSSKTSGVVFVECRDQSSSNTSNRELDVIMSSEPVTCSPGIGSSLSTLSHSMRLRTSCNNTWVEDGMECIGTTLKDASGKPVLCYDIVASLETTEVAPSDISISSTDVDVCIGDAKAFAPATIVVVGDGKSALAFGPGAVEPLRFLSHGFRLLTVAADGKLGVPGFPLQECQGDCDNDDECAGDLICFQREGTEVVPGCIGVALEETDYCIKPPQQLVAVTRSGAGSFP